MKDRLVYGLLGILGLFSITWLIISIWLSVGPVDRIAIIGFDNKENAGTAIGGILGPPIGAVASIFGALAFYVQFRANEQTKKQFYIQDFNSSFTQLLDAYTSMESSFEIQQPNEGRIVGRDCLRHWSKEVFNIRTIVFYILNPEVYNVISFGNNYHLLTEKEVEFASEVSMELFLHGIPSMKSIRSHFDAFFSKPDSEAKFLQFEKYCQQYLSGFRYDLKKQESARIVTKSEEFTMLFLDGETIPFFAHETSICNGIEMLASLVRMIDLIAKRVPDLDYKHYTNLIRSRLSEDMAYLFSRYYLSSVGAELKSCNYIMQTLVSNNWLPEQKIKDFY